MTTIRQAAIANENALIDASQARAIAAAKPRNALEAMAQRLDISPAGLKKTLLNTVFAECKNEEQFMALVVVSNSYGLNPLTKEIYAFPAKGGGIVPMVSIDGWIRLMNEHPQFDGIEFEYTVDPKSGKTIAIESIIYRRDRTRPVKVMEWMEECERSTDPWKKSPRRMLRHRALIQGVRIAFGFSGIAAENDEDVIDADYTTVPSLPSKRSFAEELDDEIPAFNGKTEEVVNTETGEVLEQDAQGMTVVDEDTARELDQRAAAEQTVADIDGPLEQEPADETPAWAAKVNEIKKGLSGAKTKTYVNEIEKDYVNHAALLPKEVADEIEAMLRDAKKRVANAEV